MLVLDPIGTRWGVEPVFTLIARLLVDVLGVARHRRHGDLLRVVDDEGGGARRRRPRHLQKERKKTDNPREGWEDGTPPPHRDFKERGVMR